jgi:hypothetical protein
MPRGFHRGIYRYLGNCANPLLDAWMSGVENLHHGESRFWSHIRGQVYYDTRQRTPGADSESTDYKRAEALYFAENPE